jgi:hypothetical protein
MSTEIHESENGQTIIKQLYKLKVFLENFFNVANIMAASPYFSYTPQTGIKSKGKGPE